VSAQTNMARALCVIGLCLITFGCLGPSPEFPKILAPSEINSDPAVYDGVDVFVRGYILVAPGEGGHALYESKELSEEFDRKLKSGRSDFQPGDYSKYCLTIANPEIFLLNQKAVRAKTLVVKGKVNATYLRDMIDLGACVLAPAIEVDVADLERRYPSLIRNRG
jgi:hypothetical protein